MIQKRTTQTIVAIAIVALASCAPTRDTPPTATETQDILDTTPQPSDPLDRLADSLATLQGALIDRGEAGVRLTLASDDIFEMESAMIRLDAQTRIREISSILASFPATRITVTAYTDSEGNEDFLRRLSQRQAQSIHDLLVDSGLARDRIDSAGLGTEEPVASNATEEGRKRNRRVEVLVTPPPLPDN